MLWTVDTLPRLQKALEDAEMTFQQLSVKEYQVCCFLSNSIVTNGNRQSCIIQKKQTHDSSVAIGNTLESLDLVMYVTMVAGM